MARIVGLDLGHRTVRAAVFEGSFGRFQLVAYHEVPVAQDLDAPPDLVSRLAALDILRGGLEVAGSTSWSATFPAESTSLRTIALPFSDRTQVEQTLQFEVENQVPFDLDDMVVTHRIIEVTEAGSEVLVGLAPKAMVGPLLAGLSDLGADPKVLLLDADLLAHHSDEGVQAVIDLGHTRTLVALCKDGHMIAGRALSHGGRDLTVAIASALDLDFETAERRKHHIGLGRDEASTVELELDNAWEDAEDTRPGQVIGEWDEETTASRGLNVAPTAGLAGSERNPEAILRDAMVPLLSDLRATLISFEDSLSVEVGEVLLCGGGAETRGLRDLLGEVLGVGVRVVYPSDEAAEAGGPGRLALCHAAGMRGGAGKGRMLDFRTGEFGFRGDLALLGTVVRYGVLAAAALVALGIGWFGFSVASLNAEISSVEDEIAESVLATFPDVPADRVSDPSMAVAIMQEKTLETTTWVETLGAVIVSEPPTLSVYDKVSRFVPPPNEARIDVSEMAVSPGSVSIKAETDSYEAAARIEAALQKVPEFRQASKGDEKKVRENILFTITIPLDGDDQAEAG